MALAELIIRAIDWFYIRPVAAVLPRQVFRYAVCGGVTYILFDPVCYFLFYNFIVAHRYVDLGFVVVSPHIAAMILVFPFTFFVGFWLNRYVAFRRSPIGAGTQLLRYLLSVAGAVLLAYAGLGILFALSTEGDFFIASLLHQCHLPPKFAYGILAAFHLMPGMAREYAQVRTAFAARGLKAGPLSMKPVFTMLVNSVRWSESIAMAMESKGFCGDAPRTYYMVPRVHWYDLAAAALMVGGVVLGMLFLKY